MADLIELDLTQEVTSFASLKAEIEKLGKIELVNFDKAKFRAEVTGQQGNFSYVISGSEKNHVIGADTLSKLAIQTKLPVLMSKEKAKEFAVSRNYSILRNAMRRQKTKESEK